jgi:hypothetical protein
VDRRLKWVLGGLAVGTVVGWLALMVADVLESSPSSGGDIATIPAPPPDARNVETPVDASVPDARDLTPEEQEALRIVYAGELERRMRKAGVAVKITAEGKRHTALRILWPECSELALDMMLDEPGYRAMLEDAGFVLVKCTDGYDTWSERFRRDPSP